MSRHSGHRLPGAEFWCWRHDDDLAIVESALYLDPGLQFPGADNRRFFQPASSAPPSPPVEEREKTAALHRPSACAKQNEALREPTGSIGRNPVGVVEHDILIPG